MPADLGPIIDEIANRADDFLVEVHDRTEARAGVAELLTADYPNLTAAERTVVIDGVISVLEEEDFFGVGFVGDPFAEARNPDDL